MNNLTVSVVMITYGHENCIEESINGVLSQISNSTIELIISDDCSPDNTEIIVNKIIRNHPNGHWIKYIRHFKNKGAIPNFAWTISQAQGKYIALCEGDDYWTDCSKIQKQVDFLENNKEYSVCFHDVEEIDHTGKLLDKRLVASHTAEKTYTIEDLAEGNFIHTVSVVFRKNFNELPSWYLTSPAGDYPLHMINASYGLIKYFPEKMAVYRVGQGVWSSQTRQSQFVNTIFIIKLMMANLTLNNEVIKNLDHQLLRLISNIKDIISPANDKLQDPEKMAYNLPIRKLVIILLKKIRYYF
ncbi:glycosyltransferase [Chryseobacterium sp. JAH]|uniref:glycosyltransferase n=1 Tax=Chryseobacterium sp. JAH TaxID=1742858 RepID=UPI000740EBB2|nr:glycosyltransferase [Chryseobacterium sp. JAH]KUJ51512.1 hypothetical protein AR685_07615 [Chryseobacterium sp. JAH]